VVVKFIPRATLLSGFDEMRAQAARSLPQAVAEHRAAVLSPQNVERLKRILREAERAAIKGGRA
jgi:peptidase E